MHALRKFIFVFIALWCLPATVQAITYIVPSDRDLVNDAKAIVIGTAMASHAELTASGGIVTVADFQVEQVLKGAISHEAIRILEPGGFLSDHAMMVPGSPRYQQGTRYLVLLDQWPDGSWRTSGLQLGQFEFTTDLRGVEYVSRGGDESIFGLDARDGSAYVDRLRKADEFLRFIRTLAHNPVAPAQEEYSVDRSKVILTEAMIQPQRKLVIALNFTRPSYLLTGNFRWESGPNATWGYCCPGNYPTLFDGPSAAASAVQGWNGIGSIAYMMSGETPGKTGGLSSPDGANTVLFNDPSDLLGNSGAFAVGGISSTMGSYQLADGFTYFSTSEVDVVVTQNSKMPGYITQSLAVSLLTHEVGHTLGFRHADGTGDPTSPPPNCDPSTSDCANSSCSGPAPWAVMAHCILSPGIPLQTWDNNAAQTVYGSGPVCTPPSVNSATATPSTITAGQSSTLSVTATGTSPTYRWYVGSPPSTASPVPGGTSASIMVTPSATTTYWVQVAACSTTANSNPVTVTVNASSCTNPSITSGPTANPSTITQGQSTTLSVSAGGTTPTYQWYVGSPGNTTNPVAGGTAASIIVTPSATTTFWVQVTACGTTANSNSVTVTVNAATCSPVMITFQPQSTQITPDQSAILTVGLSGSAPFTYQWFTGTPPGGTPISGATGSSLSVSPAATTSYYVQVTNCGGANTQTSAAATVTIVASCTPVSLVTATATPPSITPGQSVVLQASVGTGTQPFRFQWYRGVAPDTSNPIFGATSVSFTDAPATTTNYWVQVTNCSGADSANSNTVTVTVGSACTAPSITVEPAIQTIVIGTKATLSVAAAGTNIHYAWFQGTLGDTNTPVGTDSPTFTSPVLTMATSYWVHVQGDCGAVNSTTATISVRSGRFRPVSRR